ncbi:alpha/beta hydrolase [Streptomyces sp. NPDC059917]|uniref:alpha/beta hydrolase n=1 Tax=Streptomyces sp. NPDC059917 TaxID=3347002 RepID=UPI003668C97E
MLPSTQPGPDWDPTDSRWIPNWLLDGPQNAQGGGAGPAGGAGPTATGGPTAIAVYAPPTAPPDPDATPIPADAQENKFLVDDEKNRMQVKRDATAKEKPVRRNAQIVKEVLEDKENKNASLLIYEGGFKKGIGRAAVAVGNIEAADHVAVLVPGMGSSLDTLAELVRRANNLREQCVETAPGARVAVVAWVGYKAPGLLKVVYERPAAKGARLLLRDLDRWRGHWSKSATRARRHLPTMPSLTVSGLSYGSVVTGHAGAGAGNDYEGKPLIPKQAHLGSPGSGLRANHLGGSQIYSASTPSDPVSWLSRFGSDPTHRRYAEKYPVHRMKVKYHWTVAKDINPFAFTSHQSYYDKGSESLANLSRVVVDKQDEITLTAPRDGALAGHRWVSPYLDKPAPDGPAPAEGDAKSRNRRHLMAWQFMTGNGDQAAKMSSELMENLFQAHMQVNRVPASFWAVPYGQALGERPRGEAGTMRAGQKLMSDIASYYGPSLPSQYGSGPERSDTPTWAGPVAAYLSYPSTEFGAHDAPASVQDLKDKGKAVLDLMKHPNPAQFKSTAKALRPGPDFFIYLAALALDPAFEANTKLVESLQKKTGKSDGFGPEDFYNEVGAKSFRELKAEGHLKQSDLSSIQSVIQDVPGAPLLTYALNRVSGSVYEAVEMLTEPIAYTCIKWRAWFDANLNSGTTSGRAETYRTYLKFMMSLYQVPDAYDHLLAITDPHSTEGRELKSLVEEMKSVTNKVKRAQDEAKTASDNRQQQASQQPFAFAEEGAQSTREWFMGKLKTLTGGVFQDITPMTLPVYHERVLDEQLVAVAAMRYFPEARQRAIQKYLTKKNKGHIVSMLAALPAAWAGRAFQKGNFADMDALLVSFVSWAETQWSYLNAKTQTEKNRYQVVPPATVRLSTYTYEFHVRDIAVRVANGIWDSDEVQKRRRGPAPQTRTQPEVRPSAPVLEPAPQRPAPFQGPDLAQYAGSHNIRFTTDTILESYPTVANATWQKRIEMGRTEPYGSVSNLVPGLDLNTVVQVPPGGAGVTATLSARRLPSGRLGDIEFSYIPGSTGGDYACTLPAGMRLKVGYRGGVKTTVTGPKNGHILNVPRQGTGGVLEVDFRLAGS